MAIRMTTMTAAIPPPIAPALDLWVPFALGRSDGVELARATELACVSLVVGNDDDCTGVVVDATGSEESKLGRVYQTALDAGTGTKLT